MLDLKMLDLWCKRLKTKENEDMITIDIKSMMKTAIFVMSGLVVDHCRLPITDRRCSTETILSVQDQETDFARDTSDMSDTEPASDGEYEPVTEPEDDLFDDETSADSESEIITTKVISVSVGDEGDLVFADSERTDDTASDSDIDYDDYCRCARCDAVNDSPIYRYCTKCFQVRKSLFPPRPRPKRGKRARPAERAAERDPPRTLSQDSGVFTSSQGTSQDYDNIKPPSPKRRSGSLDRPAKRPKYEAVDSEPEIASLRSLDRPAKRAKRSETTDSEPEIAPLSKSVSDPSVAIENVKISKKVIADTLKGIETKELCVVCVTEPKSGVFVHGRLAHICCCYKCAVKVWMKTKRCPICKRQISNVLRAVVM